MKSKIEWTDYTINPVKGLCPMACSYCYARRMYKRFKWDPEIRFDTDTLKLTGQGIKSGSKIFVGSTMELFGDWVKPEWLKRIFTWTTAYPEHTFIFLTKQPRNLIKWSPFPDNCWVGVSFTGKEPDGFAYPLVHLQARVKFISFEPLLNSCVKNIDSFSLSLERAGINWIIIGAQTPYSQQTAPKIEWVEEIVDAATKAKIPVFLKDNLKTLFEVEKGKIWDVPNWAGSGGYGHNMLRQEFPKDRQEVTR